MIKKPGEPVIKKMKDTAAVVQEDASIYKKRYYKLVLHSIDPRKETLESFAIKMSMRLRTPMPRVKQLLKSLPSTIKASMNVTQANKLCAIMEEMGARVVVEEYYLTPGRTTGRAPAVDGLRSKSTKIGTATSFDCPDCGWENEAGADHCVLCLKIFRRPGRPPAEPVPESPPDVVPPRDEQDGGEEHSGSIIIIKRRWIALAGILFLLLVIILLLK